MTEQPDHEVLIVGLNHRTAGVDVREAIAFADEQLDEVNRERYVPYIIETSAGVDRTMLCILCDAFEEQVLEKDTRTVLHFHPAIAPIKAGISAIPVRTAMTVSGKPRKICTSAGENKASTP